MHIPSTMLSGAVCPVTIAASAVGVGIAASLAKKIENKPSALKFAAVTALIFALQMLNYPIQNGTSGHAVGAILGVSLLGIPFAVLSMTVVLAVQAFFFGDGGTIALGANILNMALIGAGIFGLVYQRIQQKTRNKKSALGLAAFFSVLASAFACSIEVAASGAVSINKIIPAMLSIHALIGLGEVALTIALVYLFDAIHSFVKENDHHFAIATVLVATVAVFASPFASRFPDGLEWVAGKLSFAEFSASKIFAIFPGYQAPFIGDPMVSTMVAGVAGTFIAFGITFLIGKQLTINRLVSA